MILRFLAVLLLSATTAYGAETLTIDSLTRNVMNIGPVSFASGQLQIDHIQVITGGGGGTLLSSLTLAVPSTLFASDVTFNVSTSNVTGTLTLANAPAGSVFGNSGVSSAPPSYITDPAAIKGLAGLSNVENTKLSTWPGSTSIINVGNIATGTIPFANVTGTLSTPQIANSAVTYAKIQDVTGLRLLGNSTGSNAAPAQIPLGTGLAFSGGSLVSTVTGGTGTVTNFSSGNLSPLFTANVATSTTTPALSFTISNAGANTFFGNATGSSAAPTFMSASAALGVLEPAQIGTNAAATWTDGTTNFIESVALTVNRIRTLPATGSYPEGAPIKYLDAITTGVFGPVFLPAGGDTLKGFNSTIWATDPSGGYNPFTAAGKGNGSKSIILQKHGTDWRVFAFGGENLSVSAFVDPLNPDKKVVVDVTGQTPFAGYSFAPATGGNSVSIFPSLATGINWVKGVNADGSLNVSPIDFNAIAPDQTGHDAEILHANATTGAYWSPDIGLLLSPFVTVSPAGVVFTLIMDGTKIEQNHAISLAANSSLQFSGIQSGMHGTIEVTHTAGSTSLTLPANSYTPVAQNGGTAGAITLSTGAGAIDVLHWYYNQVTNKYLWDNPTLNVTAAAAAVPVPELLQWKLNEGSGTTITGTVNSLNGTTSNAWTTATQTGTGTAMVLASPNTATASSTINYGVPTITVTFWLYDAAYNSTATAQPFISIGTAANSYRLYEASTKIIASLVGSATHSLVESIPAPSTSAWHFYAVVLDNSIAAGSIKIYLDNGGSQTLTLEGTNTHSGTGNFSSATFTVGGSNVSCNIDDIRIYNHELTSTEISSIYTANAQ